MRMNHVDIINVAGLLMDGKDDGIEMELINTMHPRSLQTIAPTPLGSAGENPNHAVERAVFMIKRVIEKIKQQSNTPHVILVGRSYGAFIGLLGAIRLRFHEIEKVILIEGPLHPDISVKPPLLLPPLMACGIHYQERPGLAREAINSLQELGAERIVTVQGGAEDDVVPVEAQIIPRVNGLVTGGVFTLPSQLGGRNGGVTGIFPKGYRNHLFWSREKMEAVRRIIEGAAK